MENTDHYSLEQIADFVEQRASPQLREEIEVHISSGCPTCLENVAFLQRVNNAAQAARWPSPSNRAHQKAVNAWQNRQNHFPWSLRLWMPLAFAIFSLTVIMIIFFRPQPAQAATVSGISGVVEIRKEETGKWSPVQIGQSITTGAEIRTGNTGQVILEFLGGNRIHLASKSQIRIDDFERSKKTWNITLYQTSGESESWIKAGSGDYLLQTGIGKISTNGSHFQIDMSEDDLTKVLVEDGEVEVEVNNQKIGLSQGEMTSFSSSNPIPLSKMTPTPISSQPPFQITLTPTPPDQDQDADEDSYEPSQAPESSETETEKYQSEDENSSDEGEESSSNSSNEENGDNQEDDEEGDDSQQEDQSDTEDSTKDDSEEEQSDNDQEDENENGNENTDENDDDNRQDDENDNGNEDEETDESDGEDDQNDEEEGGDDSGETDDVDVMGENNIQSFISPEK